MEKNKIITYLITFIFHIFCIISIGIGFKPGVILLRSYWEYIKFILAVMPGVFILIGLFKVWVKKETVSKYLGDGSGIKGYIIVILLAFTCVGGLFAALPTSRQLYDKGTRLSIVFTYLGASCVCRIPMTLWEASLLGARFTVIRYLTSIPLIIISSIILENLIKNKSIKEIV